HVTEKEIKDNHYDIIEINNGLSDKRIMEGIENCLLQFKLGYYPYTQIDKERMLPKNLSDTIYNESPNSIFKSVFLKCLYNKPKKLEDMQPKELKDKTPKITQKYIDAFYENKDIPIKEKNYLISCIKTLVNKHNDIINMSAEYKDKKYLRKDIDNDLFRIHVMDFNFFINEHVEYVERIQNRPFGLEMLSIENGYWDNFCKYYKQTFDVDLNISKKELKDKCMMYVKFNK
ncbi:MAG TPA: hypothetical protein VGB37_02140, partial [Candidatus Lokiarchaeia archaeon]